MSISYNDSFVKYLVTSDNHRHNIDHIKLKLCTYLSEHFIHRYDLCNIVQEFKITLCDIQINLCTKLYNFTKGL